MHGHGVGKRGNTVKTLIRVTVLVLLVVALLRLMTGCAELLPALMPDAIPLEVTHVSHISQHFAAHPTNYGYDAFYAGLKWKRGNWSLKLEEGYVAGRLDGMHEVSEASIEYDISLHR